MAHSVEPMDLDDMDTDFDNKENSLRHINMLQCTEKGYEEMDVSELNMKLRYSLTPTNSPISQSYTRTANNRNFDSEELNSLVNEGNVSLSLSSNDNINKLKSLPLQTLPKLGQELESDVSMANITVVFGNADENISTSSLSVAPTPDTVTPTDIPKNGGGSPIMRGLKSVLNMFPGSTSPIPASEYDSHSLKTPVVSPSDKSSTILDQNKDQKVAVSTPIMTHKTNEGGSKRCSPLKDSIVFKDEIEKELLWKDETTVLFSPEKVPIHKLIFQNPKQLHNKPAIDCEHNSNATVEQMDTTYNNSQIDKTNDNMDSDGEFVDCETTFTKESLATNVLQEEVIEFRDVEKSIENVTMTHLVEQASKVLLNITIPLENNHTDSGNILYANDISLARTNKSLNVLKPIDTVDMGPESSTTRSQISEHITLEMVDDVEHHIQKDSIAELEVSLDSIEIKQNNYSECAGESQIAARDVINNNVKHEYSNIIETGNYTQQPAILPSVNIKNNFDSLATNYELDSLEINDCNFTNNAVPVETASVSTKIEKYIGDPEGNVNLTQTLHELAHEVPLPDDDNVDLDNGLNEHKKVNEINNDKAILLADDMVGDTCAAVNDDISIDSITLDEKFIMHTQVNMNDTDLSQILNDIDSILKSDEVDCVKNSNYPSVNATEPPKQEYSVLTDIDKLKEHLEDNQLKYNLINSGCNNNHQLDSTLISSEPSHQESNNKIKINSEDISTQLPNVGTIMEAHTDEIDKSLTIAANKPQSAIVMETLKCYPENINNTTALELHEIGDNINANTNKLNCQKTFGNYGNEKDEAVTDLNLTNVVKLVNDKFQDQQMLIDVTFHNSKKESNTAEIMNIVKKTEQEMDKDGNVIHITQNVETTLLDEINTKPNLTINEGEVSESINILLESNNNQNVLCSALSSSISETNVFNKVAQSQKLVDSGNISTVDQSLFNINNRNTDEPALMKHLKPEASSKSDSVKTSSGYENILSTYFPSHTNLDNETFKKDALNESNTTNKTLVGETKTHLVHTSSDQMHLTEIGESNQNETNGQSVSDLINCHIVDDKLEIKMKEVMQMNQSNTVNQGTVSIGENDNALPENTSLGISTPLNFDVISENEISPQINEVNNTCKIKNVIEEARAASPPIVTKGYSYNFEELDDPFATKTILRQSPIPETTCYPPLKSGLNDKMEEAKFNETYICENDNEIQKPAKFSTEDNIESVESGPEENVTIKTDMKSMIPGTCKDVIANDVILEIDDNKETAINYKHSDLNQIASNVLLDVKTAITGECINDKIKPKNVFNIPEISGNNFNLFTARNESVFCTDTAVDHDKSTIINNLSKTHVDKMDTEPMEKESIENVSTASGTSEITDKNNTVKEINTEDEDTVEGPFLEANHSVDNAYDSDDDHVNTVKCSDTCQDEENGELFIDAEAFEFLLNQNKSNVVTDSGKESLFLKFDPLFAKRLSSDGVFAALSKIQRRQSTPSKLATVKKDMNQALPGSTNLNSTFDMEPQSNIETLSEDQFTSASKPMMAVSPAVNPVPLPRKSITPTRLNRRSLTFTSPAIAVIDNLLSMSANNSLLEQESMRQNETLSYISECNDRLAEKQIEVYNQRAENMQLKDRLDAMEKQLKALEKESEDRLRKVNDWNDKLVEKSRSNKCMESVVEEYERMIASLVAEIEQNKKQHAEERIMLINERDEQRSYLTSVELSFNDILNKFDKHKHLVISHKANEDSYKKSIEMFEENVSKMQKNYDLLKQHATSKLSHVNQELEKMNLVQEAEVLKLNTKLKRVEMRIKSLEDSMSQKTKANEELTAICEELINKIKHN